MLSERRSGHVRGFERYSRFGSWCRPILTQSSHVRPQAGLTPACTSRPPPPMARILWGAMRRARGCRTRVDSPAWKGGSDHAQRKWRCLRSVQILEPQGVGGVRVWTLARCNRSLQGSRRSRGGLSKRPPKERFGHAPPHVPALSSPATSRIRSVSRHRVASLSVSAPTSRPFSRVRSFIEVGTVGDTGGVDRHGRDGAVSIHLHVGASQAGCNGYVPVREYRISCSQFT